MRNKKETDISQYTEKINTVTEEKTDSNVKKFFKGFGKLFLTLFSIFLVAVVVAGISLGVYIITLASEPTGIDLKAKSMNQTSFIMVKDDKTGDFKEYQKLYSTENRIWVDNQNIPQYMKDAAVSIEDKRFYDHNGVDWTRTLSAVVHLASGQDTYGGSTITQQLIKNITDDNEVSLTRKLREICKALKLENEYTKDQILEAYLNVVNFGNNCQGVEAAAQLYFGKSITDCSVAQCAAIAGITQNPSLWNPLVYPENNKKRREIVINEMHEQGKITDKEYTEAMKESETMTFVGFKNNQDTDDSKDDDYVQNWYIDELFYDLQADLAQYYNISEEAAADKLYTEGLKIYCAMDEDAQNTLQESALNIDKTYDSDLQLGSVMMGFDGRVIATVGSSTKKTQALVWDRARQSTLQPGSSIKPIVVYPYAIESKKLYFSSTIMDEPVENYKVVDGQLVSGPNNWYSGYKGQMLLPDAIEWSSNGTAVQAMELIGGPSVAYKQVVTKMGFSHLSKDDAENTGGLSIGGLNGGVTVREMAAGFSYMGNGGLYYKPYTYYYVTDADGNTIIDNRDAIPKQAYSPETAAIMNRLLRYNIQNSQHTNAAYASIDNWDIVGKTGTTDADKDAWFCGMSPYAVMATWAGYDTPATLSTNGTQQPAKLFKTVMTEYLKNKKSKDYKLPSDLIKASYNPGSGLIISTDNPSGQYVGYYTKDNMPSYGSGYYDYNNNSDYYDNGNNSDYNGNGNGGNNSSGNSDNGNEQSSNSSSSAESSGNSGSSSAQSSAGSSGAGDAQSSGGDGGGAAQSSAGDGGGAAQSSAASQ